MLNLCHIFSLKRRKICAFVLIVCLIYGVTPSAESVSVKLRGKIALGGILSGLAYGTYTLVTRDKRAAGKLQLHLGPPDRVIQFERGFDRWRINDYGEQCYLFRNNLFIKTVSCASLLFKLTLRRNDVRSLNLKKSTENTQAKTPSKNPVLVLQETTVLGKLKPVARNVMEGGSTEKYFIHQTDLTAPQGKLKNPFLIDMPVSDHPTWLQLCLSRPQRVPQFVSSYPYRLEVERWLGRQPLPSR